MDGDATPEVVLSLRSENEIRCVSGSTGRIVWTSRLGTGNGSYGFAMETVGDVNSDGTGDLAVGEPDLKRWWRGATGHVHILSGTDGHVLRTFRGSMGDAWFGSTLAAGDLDYDGRTDLIVSGLSARGEAATGGEVNVFSGIDKEDVRSVSGPGVSFWGGEVVWMRHATNTGRPGLVISELPWKRESLRRGPGGSVVEPVRMFVVTGTLNTDRKLCEGLVGLVAVGDVDRDEITDFVAADQDGSGVGLLRGASNRRSWTRPTRVGEHVEAYGPGPDLDGDGADDILIGGSSVEGRAFLELLSARSGEPLWTAEYP